MLLKKKLERGFAFVLAIAGSVHGEYKARAASKNRIADAVIDQHPFSILETAH